jgi:cAMP phosphodiesterase
VTGFLVRSTASQWAKGSLLAVDAGSHLSAITRILEKDFPLFSEGPDASAAPPKSSCTSNPSGDYAVSPKSAQIDQNSDGFSSDTPSSSRPNSPAPPAPITTLESGAFGGLPFPHASARANALHLVRELVATYLITHPHLDHHGGFVMNTAAFHNTSRPKRLAALPFTVNAIKTHVFNDVIWPNLTDEDGGVGFVTFQRLAEGGNIALGEGHGRGYIEVCDGLAVKGFKVSHGHCMKGPSHIHRGSIPNALELASGLPLTHNTQGSITANGREGRSLSFSAMSNPGTPMHAASAGPNSTDHAGNQCVIDSTAFFIRAETLRSSSGRSASVPSAHGGYNAPYPSSREVLVFGDVEPDSISLTPRNARVWSEAAPKIAAGILKGIFIECSYTDAQPDAVLFGHLAPRHLIAELCTLADMVREARRERERERLVRKRKRNSRHMEVDDPNGTSPEAPAGTNDVRRRRSKANVLDDPAIASGERNQPHLMTLAAGLSPRVEQEPPTWDHPPDPDVTPTRSKSVAGLPSHHLQQTPTPATTQTPAAQAATVNSMADLQPPLAGVTVVAIHVKDTFQDGPPMGQKVLAELRAHEDALARQGRALGCQFDVASSGASYWF